MSTIAERLREFANEIGMNNLDMVLTKGEVNTVFNVEQRLAYEDRAKELFPWLKSATLLVLMIAMNESEHAVKKVLDAGADVTKRCYGWAPIHYAACMDDDLVKVILDRDPDQANAKTDNGSMPLHLAVSTDSYSCILELLKHGADPNAVNNNGNTALHIAAALKMRHAMGLLVEYGADVTLKDAKGRTVRDVAEAQGLEKIIDFLNAFEKAQATKNSNAAEDALARSKCIKADETDPKRIGDAMHELAKRLAVLETKMEKLESK